MIRIQYQGTVLSSRFLMVSVYRIGAVRTTKKFKKSKKPKKETETKKRGFRHPANCVIIK